MAAIPRLVPDGMTRSDLIEMLARLTVSHTEWGAGGGGGEGGKYRTD